MCYYQGCCAFKIGTWCSIEIKGQYGQKITTAAATTVKEKTQRQNMTQRYGTTAAAYQTTKGDYL